jgi:magnesium-transporting ATPase (P-type)
MKRFAKYFYITVIVLIQGMILVILNQQFDFFNKYLFAIKLFSLFYVVITICLLKVLLNNINNINKFKEEYDPFDNFKIE